MTSTETGVKTAVDRTAAILVSPQIAVATTTAPLHQQPSVMPSADPRKFDSLDALAHQLLGEREVTRLGVAVDGRLTRNGGQACLEGLAWPLALGTTDTPFHAGALEVAVRAAFEATALPRLTKRDLTALTTGRIEQPVTWAYIGEDGKGNSLVVLVHPDGRLEPLQLSVDYTQLVDDSQEQDILARLRPEAGWAAPPTLPDLYKAACEIEGKTPKDVVDSFAILSMVRHDAAANRALRVWDACSGASIAQAASMDTVEAVCTGMLLGHQSSRLRRKPPLQAWQGSPVRTLAVPNRAALIGARLGIGLRPAA